MKNLGFPNSYNLIQPNYTPPPPRNKRIIARSIFCDTILH
jgi:hypothetical protein